ncbi:MAG: MATE family efflux transporter [Tidjanibacter sp.]|nr:MATE family efflux transporter [Tidjanibacter sp.]
MSKTLSLSDHFTTSRLLRYTLPTVVMMIATSIYSVVDGIFVSNFVGKTPFAAVNIIWPIFMVIGSVGFMMGAGGSALVAKILGEGDTQRANRTFSLIVYTTLAAGITLSLITFILLRPISAALGAEEEILECCVRYGRILLIALPTFLLQGMFQPFMVAADKPSLGLKIALMAGATNILFDYLLIIPCNLGLEGAAIATALSQCVAGIVPFIYFRRPNNSRLHLGATRWDGTAIGQTCLNGSSEMATNISTSIVVMLYNYQLLRHIGEDGVAAYGVIGYVLFIFIAVFLGYSTGSAPIVSYNYGAQRHEELRGVVWRSFRIIVALSMGLTITAELLAPALSHLFVGYDKELYALTLRALRIYSLSFLLCGVNIYTSSLFTALNNGVVSAIVSFSRTLVFESGAVLLIPLVLGIDGIWWAVSFAEGAALVMSIAFVVRYRHRYNLA